MKKAALFPSVLLFVVVTVSTAFAQRETVAGQVKDDSGKVMHGVLVKAKTGGVTLTVMSQPDGRFTITGLRPGTYEVRAERRGFVSTSQQLAVPAAGPVSFTLKPGPIDRSNLSNSDLERVLPDGPYKQQTLACETCHTWTALASRKKFQLQDWINGITLMDGRFRLLNKADFPGWAEYLHANFGPESTLDPKLPPEPIDVRSLNIRYVSFDIPTYHAMPHTAVPDGKGNVWFTEYGAQKIGMVNAKTGKMEQFSIPSKIAPSPHGITLDPSGFVWFTEQTSGMIGRFDPNARTFKEYPLPAPKNKPQRGPEQIVVSEGASQRRQVAPHTPIADERGHIWFTSGSNPVMRLNPESGEVTEYVIREGGGGLYGITRDPRSGRIWYAGLGINEVGYIDPDTGKVSHFSMVTPNAGPKRLHIDSKGIAWFNMANVSKLGRVDPTTGKVTEWNLPGSRDGWPYALGIDSKDRIWTTTYHDDLLHMFDPRTERFITYLLPQKGNGMRDFFLDEDGWLWAGQFGQNKVLGFRLEE